MEQGLSKMAWQGGAKLIYVSIESCLVRFDPLLEGVAAILKHRPLDFLKIPFWALRGKGSLEARVMGRASIDVPLLPFRRDLITELQNRKQSGSTLVLVYDRFPELVSRVADHIGLFDRILRVEEGRQGATDGRAECIVRDAAGVPFSYVGIGEADIPVWRSADFGIAVNASRSLRSQLNHVVSFRGEVATGLQSWIKGFVAPLRPHQWVKNFLLYVPLVAAHQWSNLGAVGAVTLGFISFSVSASAVYIFNDLLDLSADRRHPRKRRRPFASGMASIGQGIFSVPILIGIGALIAWIVGTEFLGILLVYLATTFAYSWILKAYVLIDVIALSALYTIRVVAGAAAINVTPSFWLLAFSGFIFLSLALVKRCSELVTLEKFGRKDAVGRDYSVSDMQVLQVIGISAGVAAIVVLALYVNSPEAFSLYQNPGRLSLVCVPLFYCIVRLWLKTARGEMHDDPIVYAASDRGCRVMAVLAAALLFFGI